MSDRVTVAPSWLRSAVTSIFTAAGLSTNAAKTVAESLVAADMRGITSHGALLVPMYVERLLAGSVSPRERAEMVVTTASPSWCSRRTTAGGRVSTLSEDR